jgi:hypothetical protein
MYAVAPIITPMAHTRPRVQDLASRLHGASTATRHTAMASRVLARGATVQPERPQPNRCQARGVTIQLKRPQPDRYQAEGLYNTTRETAAKPVSSQGRTAKERGGRVPDLIVSRHRDDAGRRPRP